MSCSRTQHSDAGGATWKDGNYLQCSIKVITNTNRYNTDLDKTLSSLVVAPKFFNQVIFQRDYRKMTIKWSFAFSSFVKWSLYNTLYL